MGDNTLFGGAINIITDISYHCCYFHYSCMSLQIPYERCITLPTWVWFSHGPQIRLRPIPHFRLFKTIFLLFLFTLHSSCSLCSYRISEWINRHNYLIKPACTYIVIFRIINIIQIRATTFTRSYVQTKDVLKDVTDTYTT